MLGEKRRKVGSPTLVSRNASGALVTWRQRLCYRLLPRFALGLGRDLHEKTIASVSPASGEAQLSGRGVDCANPISIFPSSIFCAFPPP